MKTYSFYGSIINTILLLVLITLMVVALKVMLKDKDIYFPYLSQKKLEVTTKNDESMDLSSISGNKEDLLSFSIWPNTKVHGVVSYRGSIKGGYFFEGNILINILDSQKKNILKSNAPAKGEWMTSGPVEFEGNIDFSKLPKGEAYIEIHNDNVSGLAENDKSVLVPVVIE
jgi:hypothetical protein